MRKMSESELKQEAFRILSVFDNFCQKNGLKYVLAYGTLLGAVRHHGFIPWDDDIDVLMPRKDYERLIQTYPDGDAATELLAYKKDPEYIYPFVKIVSQRTCVIETGWRPEYRYPRAGVWIDVFPVDNLGNNVDDKIWKEHSRIEKVFSWITLEYRPSKSIWKRLPKWILYHCIMPFCRYDVRKLRNRLDTQMEKYFFQETKYVGSICWAEKREEMPRECWNNLSKKSFEGKEFFTYNDFYNDMVLRQQYGSNYMELPPIEERVHHEIEAYWL